MKQYKVVKQFNDSVEGDLVWLNERRAASELRNGNVVEVKEEKVEVKEEKVEVKTKEEKVVLQTKQSKAPVKRKKK